MNLIVLSTIQLGEKSFEGEWKSVKGSRYFESFDLYKENGFKEEKDAKALIDRCTGKEANRGSDNNTCGIERSDNWGGGHIVFCVT